jgi:hypothetical protein
VDDYDNQQISQTDLNGDTLEIRVISVNNHKNERHRINNITVTGFDYCESLGTLDDYDTAITLVNFGSINNAT